MVPYGNKTYGPYTAKKIPDAVPADADPQSMAGVELFRGEEIFFRGGVQDREQWQLFRNAWQ